MLEQTLQRVLTTHVKDWEVPADAPASAGNFGAGAAEEGLVLLSPFLG